MIRSVIRYTTAAPENLDQNFQGTDFKAPMAGFGQSCVTCLLIDEMPSLTIDFLLKVMDYLLHDCTPSTSVGISN